MRPYWPLAKLRLKAAPKRAPSVSFSALRNHIYKNLQQTVAPWKFYLKQGFATSTHALHLSFNNTGKTACRTMTLCKSSHVCTSPV